MEPWMAASKKHKLKIVSILINKISNTNDHISNNKNNNINNNSNHNKKNKKKK